jgi:[acyl-carrier-protein] S-malonyltransferase
VEFHRSKLALGYSLGELVALGCCGMFAPEELLRVPLTLADDCAKLASDVTMGVLFSRGPVIDELDVLRLCIEITSSGQGTIGISAILSPNTYLLLGQGDTVQQFKSHMHELLPHRAHLRISSHRWPPVHTPIVRHKHIPDRTAVMLESVPGGITPPYPTVLSLVTGKQDYDDHTARQLLRQWSDHPQRLWDCVYETLACGVETVVHVGPEPNVIPATYRRLSENIQEQISGKSLGSISMRAAAGLARRPWLSSLLPSRAALLRAPRIRHVILEDWLLENVPE